MDKKRICILVAVLVLFISLEAAIVFGDDNKGGDNGKGIVVGDQKGDKNEVKNNDKNGNDDHKGDDHGDDHKGGDDKDHKGGDDDKGEDDKDHKGGNDDDKGHKGDDDNGHKGGDDDDKDHKGGDDDDKGKGNKGKDDDKKKKPDMDPETTNYDVLTPSAKGCERAFCKAKGACHLKTLECPAECPERKPKKHKKKKGCFVHCGSKCEVVCKCKISLPNHLHSCMHAYLIVAAKIQFTQPHSIYYTHLDQFNRKLIQINQKT